MKLIVLILQATEHLEAVITAWREAGLRGVTSVESFGGGAAVAGFRTGDLPMFGSVGAYLRAKSQHSYVIFSVVPSDAMVKAAARATETIVGDLGQPDRGLFFVVPVEQVLGYRPAD